MPRLIAPGGHALDLQELPCRLGTSPELEFTVNDGLEVGPHQFTIRLEGPLYIIEHEGGKTKTFLNDKPVTEDAILKNGDIIRAGQLRLEFSNPEQASNPFTSSVAGVPVSIENRSARRALAAHKFADALAAAVRRQRDSNKPGLNDHAITQALARVNQTTQEKSKPEPHAVAEQPPPSAPKNEGGSASESNQGVLSTTPESASRTKKNAIPTPRPRKEPSAPMSRTELEKAVPDSSTTAPAAHLQPPASELKTASGSGKPPSPSGSPPASASQPTQVDGPHQTNENGGVPRKGVEQGPISSQTASPIPVPPPVPTQKSSSRGDGEERAAAKLPQGIRPLVPRTRQASTMPAPVFRPSSRHEDAKSSPPDEEKKSSGKGIPTTELEEDNELPVRVTGFADRSKPASGPAKAETSSPSKADSEPSTPAPPKEFRPLAPPPIPGEAKISSVPHPAASENKSDQARPVPGDRSRPVTRAPQTPPRQEKAAGAAPQVRDSATSGRRRAPDSSITAAGAVPMTPRTPMRTELPGPSRAAEPRSKPIPERPKENPFKLAAADPKAPQPTAKRVADVVSSGQRPDNQDLSSTHPVPVSSEVVTSTPVTKSSPHAVTKALVSMEPETRPALTDRFPWARIAAAFIIAFAVAGALVAWKGSDLLTMAKSTLGMEPAITHEPYLDRLLAEDPEVLLTMDADACIDRYGRYAVESGGITIAELQEHFLSGIPSLRLRDLELLTYSRDRSGNPLVIASTSEDLKRASLIEEFGGGLATEESVGAHVVYSGYLNGESPIKFAFLNDRTLLLGAPTAVGRYFELEPSPGDTSNDGQQPREMLMDGKQLVRFYIGKGQTKDLTGSAIDPEALLRSKGLAASELTGLALWGSIGSQLEVTLAFSFQSKATAQTFVSAPQTEVNRFASALAGSFPETEIETGNLPFEVEMALVDENVHMRIRGAFMDFVPRGSRMSESLGTLAGLRSEIGRLVAPADSESAVSDVELIAAEDFEAQQLALSLAELHASAAQAGAPALRGLTDIDAIIENLHSGVKGDGIYQNYVFRLKVPSELRSRIGRFLMMKGSQLHYVQEGIDAAKLSQNGGVTEATE